MEPVDDSETVYSDGIDNRDRSLSSVGVDRERTEYESNYRPSTAEARLLVNGGPGQPRLSRTPMSMASMASSSDEEELAVLITEPPYESEPEIEPEPEPIRRRRKKKTYVYKPTHDIDDSALWDTDLELEEEGENHDISGRAAYIKVCERLGIVPASYFLKNITNPSICMKHHGLGVQGTRAVAKVLKNNVTTERLDLSSNWMEDQGGLYVAKMMVDNDYITELNISDNHLGALGAVHICKVLKINITLRKIDLSQNEFGDTEASLFADVLEENKHICELNLSRNRFGEEAGKVLGPAICTNDVLEHIDLSWNQLRLKGAVAIAKGLKENVRLKTCCLAWNGFGHDGGIALADALSCNDSLTELDVTGNRFDAHVATHFAKSLSKNEQLITIRMGNNPINSAGTIILAKSLRDSNSSILKLLDLTDIPVEYEYLRLVNEIKKSREFEELHGLTMRSGNTPVDIGTAAVDPEGINPMKLLKQHVVVRDTRALDVLRKLDPEGTLAVTPEVFAEALKELGLPYHKKHLNDMVKKMQTNDDGLISYSDLLTYEPEEIHVKPRPAPPERQLPLDSLVSAC